MAHLQIWPCPHPTLAGAPGQGAPSFLARSFPGRAGRWTNCPIWEILATSLKDIPPEELALLPKDGASQVDHYVLWLPQERPVTAVFAGTF
jgi:hypothetical protein